MQQQQLPNDLGTSPGASPTLEYSPVPTVKLTYKDFTIVVEDTCADSLSSVLTHIVSTYKLLSDVGQPPV